LNEELAILHVNGDDLHCAMRSEWDQLPRRSGVFGRKRDHARQGASMKRILILAALLAGCGPTTGARPGGEEKPQPMDPWLYEDRATGCQYLATSSIQALTPRIAADGKTHMGCKGAQP
jgi:hypothetical protein